MCAVFSRRCNNTVRRSSYQLQGSHSDMQARTGLSEGETPCGDQSEQWV